ncbi:MAG: phosphoribosyl-AMP cyclohydrolase [Candidatus Aureabacteria bacterium]|nr:phosphoribosyl-AMP cyclohydrolase [Candidatus Auribacterota bacterium]
MEKFFALVKFNDQGLVPVIAQDVKNGEVLMMAWMNRETLQKTIETGLMHYWSRSRKKVWLKGETSGHTQKVKEIRFDCDVDTLLMKIEQKGGACHEGYRSCFFRKLAPDGADIEISGEKVFSPEKTYQKK